MMNKNTENKLVAMINTMSMEDMIQANRIVVSIIKHKRTQDSVGQWLKYKVGDKVAFSLMVRGSNDYGHKIGEIVKVNRVKAIVRVGNELDKNARLGVMWNVPFSMLTKIK